jgi:hypothetical protein
MLDAKIGGITPAMFELERQERRLVHVRAATALAARVVHRDPALSALNEYDQEREAQNQCSTRNTRQRTHVAIADLLEHAKHGGGQARDDAAKMINETPLPMPRSVTCSPSHIRNIVPAVSEITAVR